ncbi:MAG: dynamin family protein [Bacteroidaceae bacterium]|nr:dynamin family protein [Bacteroidaceae bacterium]
MDYKELEKQLIDVRSQIKSVYQEMNGIDSSLLPPKDTEFIDMGSRLDNEQYDVVVCGEVKKGKSSFINAIIGDDLLPVNTDVATSQVFRIVNDTQVKYELVFINGSRKEISRDDLTKYGSQIAANEKGLPQFDVAIDYIEIHYPIEFLPKNIAIVDTPGIGAVYAEHERITRRYLAKASAVIFIMDPQNPMTAPEKSFVESALSVTNRVVFVMTKMDNYDAEYIVNMVRRNEEILSPFENSIWNNSVQVLPMSSKILKDAASNEDEDLRNLDVIGSQYDKVQESVLRMIYTMIGLGDNIEFTNQLITYDRSVQAAIKDFETTLHDNGTAAQLLQERQNLQSGFAVQWGPQSQRYIEITQAIADQANSISNKLALICSQTGSVAERFKSEIDNLSSSDEAKQYGKDFSTRTQDAIQQAVREEIDTVSDNINQLLQEYSSEISASVTSANDVIVNGVSTITVSTDGDGISKSINGFRMNYYNVLLFMGVGSIFGPIGSALGALAGLIISPIINLIYDGLMWGVLSIFRLF